MAHDGDSLLVSFEMRAEPPLTMIPEGSPIPAYQGECVELFLAGSTSPTRYLEIVVAVSGALYTALVDNPDGSRATWRVEPHVPVPGLSVVIAGLPADRPRASWNSWSCDLRIPWASMPFGNSPPRPREVLRGNAYRIARGVTTRFEALSPTLRSAPPDFHVPERFARFRFMN